MTVRRMVNPVMAYTWGSRDGIATLQGRPATGLPEAELWMGAHPQAPSQVVLADGSAAQPLDAVIAADPVGVLGERCVERFGQRLPFLLKVLSAELPLSLQVHPDDEQARRGFAAEEAAGVDRSASERTYRDPFGKPEMLVALTDFQLLQGFRPAHDAAATLAALRVHGLESLINALEGGTPTGEVFLRLIEWPADDRNRLVADVAAASSALLDVGVAPWIPWFAATYPGDPGVVGALLLNYLAARPLQGLYVRPGQIHTYLHGTGIEILGGSDNVARAGLTPKHVSVGQLREILSVDAAEPAVVAPIESARGVQTWPTPQPEFELHRQHISAMERLEVGGPAVLLCLDGKLEIGDRDGSVTLGPGESAFAFAGADLAVAGNGVLVRANPGTG